jgi:hypothetical protein
MARHALPQQRATHGRTAAVVSASTLLLCLWSTGTALADTGVDPLGSVGVSVPGGDGDPTAPIRAVVKQVTSTVGVSDPLDASTAHPRVHRHGKRPTTAPGSTDAKRPTTGRHARTHRAAATPTPTSVTPVLGLSELRLMAQETAPAGATLMAPDIAGSQHEGVLAAAGTNLRKLVPGTNELADGRAILLAMATVLLGCLAGGHIKVAQDGIALLDMGSGAAPR